jgi:hypothetical protein
MEDARDFQVRSLGATHCRAPAWPLNVPLRAVQEDEAADNYVKKFWQQILDGGQLLQPNAPNVFPFPDPAHTTNPLDPEAFLYHGSHIVFIAWDLQFGSLLKKAYGKPMPPCPTCGKAACVQAKGWADPRRVFDHNKVVFLSSRRYRCTTSGKPHAWERHG